MPFSYERKMLSDSMGYTAIIDPKLKTNTIQIKLIVPISPKTAAAYALASSLLCTSCKNTPSMSAMSRRMNKLYGAFMAADVSKLGDYQIINFSFSALCNKYALDGEDILGELLTVIGDCLFRPNAADGAFTQAEFEVKRRDLLDTIEAEINDKRDYAVSQCIKTAQLGEPSAHSCYGTKEEVLSLTPASVYDAYCHLLRISTAEIYYAGGEDDRNVRSTLAAEFSAIKRNAPTLPDFTSPSPLKAEPEVKTEPMAVAQCKMVLAFKTDYNNINAMFLMNAIYGGTAFSKLFTNVREKLSLCYYCSSSYSETKRTFFVDCGVENANIEKAKSEILAQLRAVAEGDFTDELLENSRLSIYNSIRMFGSSAASYIRWYFTELIRGKNRDVKQTLSEYSKVTREDIMAAAASLSLDTVYILEANGEEAEEYGD